MKIGVWVDGPIDKLSGGSYTYNGALLEGIDRFDFGDELEICFLSYAELTGFQKACINIAAYQQGISLVGKVFRRLLKILSKDSFANQIDAIDQREKRLKDASAASYLTDQGVKIVFYPSPSSRIINGVPYILNNWDLAHHSSYSFPEFVDDDGFNRRNEWYMNVMPSALFTFAETEAGKQELINYLRINPDSIRVLPIFSSNHLPGLNVSSNDQENFLMKFGLKSQHFFFYPAQFWAHKNHYTLLLAFQKFALLFPDFKLVLCGSDKGNIDYIKKCATDFGLTGSVVFTGFVDDGVLYSFYKNAKALVMPTLLGPSNIPPLEATLLGCPVLCSNLNGHVEMLQDAALYFDPLDELTIFDAMLAVMDDLLINDLLEKQRELAVATPHTIENALLALQSHFKYAARLRRCWE